MSWENKFEARKQVAREYRLCRRDAALSHHDANIFLEKEGFPDASRHGFGGKKKVQRFSFCNELFQPPSASEY